MVETALTRTARALDLVPFVIEHPGIAIEELAKEFGVTPAQIVSDLSMIFMCGLPGYSTLELIDLSYEDGFVSIIDPQVLDRPRNLTKSELISLMLALDSLASLRAEGDPIKASIRALQAKLQRTITSAVQAIPVVQREEANGALLPLCESAVKSGSGLSIEYVSATSDKKSSRVILPEAIYAENGFIYLRAWCYLTNSTRTFRLDRIIAAEPVTVSQLPVSQPEPLNEEFSAQLEISPGARIFYEQNSSIMTLDSQSDDHLAVTIHLRDSEWLIRSLMGYGSLIRVLEPQALVQELAKRAESALELYRQR